MASLNKVMLIGNLTRDPEVRYTPKGSAVCDLAIAVNRTYATDSGEKVQETIYVDVVVWARLAEVAGQYLKKGSSVFVEGRMQTRSWEKDGEKKYRTEVVADRVQFGPRGSGSAGSGAGGCAGRRNDAEEMPPAGDEGGSSGPGIDYPKDEINPDDIPF